MLKHENDYTAILKKESFEPRESLVVHAKKLPDCRGRYAMDILERFATIMADEDGEDSSGRQKLKRMKAKEVVKIACDISNELFKELENRKWLLDSPKINVNKDNLGVSRKRSA